MSKHRHQKKQHHQNKSSQPTFRIGEQATPERRKQNGGVVSEVMACDYSGNVRIEREKAKIECIIDYYFLKKWLTELQRAVAIRYRGYYVKAHYGPYSTVFNDKLKKLLSGKRDPDAAMIDFIKSVEQLRRAEKKLTVAQIEVVRRVCGYDQHAGDTRYRLTLQRALDILAKHWKTKA